MLFCCLWHNVETSCHKHFVIASRSIDSTQLLQIYAQNRDFCIPHLHSTPLLEYCHDVWYGKTRMMLLPDGHIYSCLQNPRT